MTPNEPTVLVVDDERGIRDLIHAWLQDDYTVRVAGDGRAAIDLLDDSIDLALLDRRMPGVTGDEVLATIREEGYDFPVAMITAVSPDVDIVDMAFDDYVVKPVTKEEVRAVVETLIQRASYDQKSREFFRLASKKAKLEASETVDHRGSEEYDRLVEKMATIREDLDDVLGDLSTSDFRRAFEEI
ncbi:MAG: response regulator [Halanaeroarchaeum sp.]